MPWRVREGTGPLSSMRLAEALAPPSRASGRRWCGRESPEEAFRFGSVHVRGQMERAPLTHC